MDNGTRLRLRGEGEGGNFGGPAGDLYVVISVEPHDTFKRQGQDLIVPIEISFVQAALGAKIEIPTLEEPVTVEIPKGTQPGEVLRLKGLGIPYIGEKKTWRPTSRGKYKNPNTPHQKAGGALKGI